MPKKPPAQLELFAGRVSAGEVHSLGLLGWRDPLWTTRFLIELLDGTKLPMTLATIRQLHAIARSKQPDPPPESKDRASSATNQPALS